MKPKFLLVVFFFALVFLCWLCLRKKKSRGCFSHIVRASCIGIIVHVGAISLSHWCCPSHVGVDSFTLVCLSHVAIVSLVLVLFLSCWCSSWCYFLVFVLPFPHWRCFSFCVGLATLPTCYCCFLCIVTVAFLSLVLLFFLR
jgi:hypothetical protein